MGHMLYREETEGDVTELFMHPIRYPLKLHAKSKHSGPVHAHVYAQFVPVAMANIKRRENMDVDLSRETHREWRTEHMIGWT